MTSNTNPISDYDVWQWLCTRPQNRLGRLIKFIAGTRDTPSDAIVESTLPKVERLLRIEPYATTRAASCIYPDCRIDSSSNRLMPCCSHNPRRHSMHKHCLKRWIRETPRPLQCPVCSDPYLEQMRLCFTDNEMQTKSDSLFCNDQMGHNVYDIVQNVLDDEFDPAYMPQFHFGQHLKFFENLTRTMLQTPEIAVVHVSELDSIPMMTRERRRADTRSNQVTIEEVFSDDECENSTNSNDSADEIECIN